MVRVRGQQLRAGFAVAAISLLSSVQGSPGIAASLSDRVQQACLSDEAQDDRPAVLAPAVWSVIGPPVIPVKGTDGRIHLAYEILFTNVLMRHALFEAANSHLRRSKKWSTLRAWGVKLAKRIGARKACVAVARKLAVIMHRMWVEEKNFRFGQPPVAKAA
jgi:hypothetical protein